MAIRAAAILIELVLCPIALTWRAVQSLVLSLVYISLCLYTAINLLNDMLMTFLGCTDEIIIRYIKSLPKALKRSNDLIDIFLWRYTILLRILLYLQAVFVTARQKEHIISCKALKTRDRVRYSRTICMPDMKLRTRIIYWSRYIEFLFLVILLCCQKKFPLICPDDELSFHYKTNLLICKEKKSHLFR